MLNRWFFCWVQDDALDFRLQRLPCSAIIGGPEKNSSAYFVQEGAGLLVIGFQPGFWKLDEKNWYRQAIRKAILRVGGIRPTKPFSRGTMMVWSNDESVFPKDSKIPFRVSRFPEDEVALTWGWVTHVTNLPLKDQRSEALFWKEFLRWEETTRKSRSLPKDPMKSR